MAMPSPPRSAAAQEPPSSEDQVGGKHVVNDKISPVGIGLGISTVEEEDVLPSNGDAGPEHDLSSKDTSSAQEARLAEQDSREKDAGKGMNGDHTGIPQAEEASNRSTAPPPPPPKSPSPHSSSDKPLPPRTGTPTKVQPQKEEEDSLQDIDLSRKNTPARVNAPPHRAPSITSLPSPSASAMRSPTPSSRPTSTRPQSRTTSGAGFRPAHHSRRSSTATTLSLSGMPNGSHGSGPTPQLSSVLITPPLQLLVQSKEAKKSASFLASAQKALDLCQAGTDGAGSNAAYLHPREIFEPLRLAISNPQTTSVPILITSLDLLSKLVSHSFFSEPNGPPKGQSPLPDLITHTITLSWSETSPPQVALQVVQSVDGDCIIDR